MDTVTFMKDDVALELPTPAQSTTENGVALSFRGLTGEQKQALTDFFKETANGMGETWCYRNEAEITVPARFGEPMLVFVAYKGDWDVSMSLVTAGRSVVVVT